MNGTETSSPSLSPRTTWSERFRSWRTLRQALLVLAILTSLVAVFYTVENVRGKRAWEKCKRELEAKGMVLDWDHFIPPPVPDDQNFFKAPRMSEWFVGRGPTELSNRTTPTALTEAASNAPRLLVAEFTISPPGQTPPLREGDIALDLNDTAAREQALKGLQDAIGPNTVGRGSYAFTLVARPLKQIKPARFFVRSAAAPSVQDIVSLFPGNGIAPPNATIANNTSRLRVEAAGPDSFRVFLTPAPQTAADFLAWSDQFEPDFRAIHEALQRPFARIDCDYQVPEAIGIPNFVTIRQFVQLLSSRAECDYLLAQPENALRELTFLNDSRRIMEAPPTGKPMTLVSSMINVAVVGLYADVIADGLRMHAWREPQLIALQEQLKAIDALPAVMLSVNSEMASVTRTLEATPRARLSQLLFDISGTSRPTRADRIQHTLIRFMPRGWVYQNMAVVVTERQKMFAAIDNEHGLIRPQPLNLSYREAEARFGHFSPYTFVAGRTVPNFKRAFQTLARQQTLAHQALIACALERYHLARGDYPEALESLSPQFIEKIPNDLIGGQPLRYRRLDADQFLLYSVAWNETDDGGKAPPGEPSYTVYEEGDWVWR